MAKICKLQSTDHMNYKTKDSSLEFIYKKLCIYSYMFKLQSPSKYSPFEEIHLSRLFSTAQNSFWIRWFWCLLVLLPFFVSPLPHWQNVSLWGFFIQGIKKKLPRWIRVNRENGARGPHCFLVKNYWTLSMVWAGVLVSHPSWNGRMRWVFKKIHWSWMQPLTTPPAGTLTQMGS